MRWKANMSRSVFKVHRTRRSPTVAPPQSPRRRLARSVCRCAFLPQFEPYPNQTITLSGSPSGLSVVSFGSTRVIVGDKKTVSGFWAPRLSTTSLTGHVHYDLTPDIPSVLVLGPYLVRSATAHGSVLQLTGDLNATTTLDVFAPKQFTSVTWNGAPVHITVSSIGSLRGQVGFPAALTAAKIPVLANLAWKCADSLPELDAAFDDSTWVLANKTTTQRPQQPTAGKV